MDQVFPERAEVATLSAASSCQQRQDPAEPLWFAVMCREIYGPNAPKELQFVLGKSERTCRAWASGDSVPPSTILWALMDSKRGDKVFQWLMRDSTQPWWRELKRAQRIAAQVDQLNLE